MSNSEIDVQPAHYNTVKHRQKSPSMSQLHEVTEHVPDADRVQFEPTDFYVHEVLRFKCKHASLRDKVATFNEATGFWE